MLHKPSTAITDGQFATIGGLRVYYHSCGQGSPTLLLIHGSMLSMFTWRAVMSPLAELGSVLAFDRPAFGKTDRPMPGKDGSNPYTPEAQTDLIVALMDYVQIEQAVLVGNSAGGSLALIAALRHPQRVAALVLAAPMVYSGYAVTEFPPRLQRFLRGLGPLGPLQVRVMLGLMHQFVYRGFWHDKAKFTPELLAAYRREFLVPGWNRAFWNLILASHALHLAAQLPAMQIPTLVMTGDQDRTVPTRESIRLAEALPNATLSVIANCGHLPHEEQPEAFIAAVRTFLLANDMR